MFPGKQTYILSTLIVTALLWGCFPVRAQQTAIDSVLVKERMEMPDIKAKADSLLKLATWFRGRMDIEPLLAEALRVAQKTGYKEIEVKLTDYYGVYMRDRSRYSESIGLHLTALELAREQKNVQAQIVVLNNLGVVYRRIDESVEALKYHYEALHLAEQSHDFYNISIALNSIGNVHLLQHNYREAIRCFRRCLPIAEQSSNRTGIAMNLNNLGEAYEYLHLLDSARYYYQKSLAQNHQINSRKGEAICYNSLGNLSMKEGKSDEAILLFTKSLEINRLLNDRLYTAESCVNLGRAYLEKKQFGHAGENLQEGLSTALIIGSKTTARDAYKGLMALHEQTMEFSKAYYECQKYKLYADSVVNEANSKAMMQMEAIYATEQKELKIAALEREKQLYVGWGATGGALALLLLSFLMVRHRLLENRRKVVQQQRALVEQRVLQLEQEKQLITAQAVLEGETAERTRLARDLHDGLGGMLSVVKLNLYDVKNGAAIDGIDIERFTHALGLLDESIRELRRVAHNMMPGTLARYGLRASLTDFCSNIPEVDMHWFGNSDRLEAKLEMMIYRTVLELINNALKHSGAACIMVQAVQEADRFAITVQDNGCGFDPEASMPGTGLGNIRNRAGSFNGRMEIWSEKGKGTEVSIEFKL